jgi:hypothetical protein
MREIRHSARIRQRGIGLLATRNWKETDTAGEDRISRGFGSSLVADPFALFLIVLEVID